MGALFLVTFVRTCGPTHKHLWLGLNYDEVPPDLSILPKLASLGLEMTSDEIVERLGEDLDEWFATALPTCVALERLTIMTESEVGYHLDRTPQRLLTAPEVAAALPATLKRIDFDVLPKEGELEAVLSNVKGVQVISMPRQVRSDMRMRKITLLTFFSPAQTGDFPWLEFCRQRGIEVVETDMDEWPV